jgi:hypothetical protein
MSERMSDDRPPLPARQTLDRAALERVLGRAAELSLGSPESLEALTEAQVVDIGKEVGIPERALRQALAEERTRAIVPEEPGIVAQYFGSGGASASRSVAGTPETVLAFLDRWMTKEECLTVKRRFPDRMTWEPKRDFFSSMRRDFNLGGRGYALARAVEVGATVVAVDAGRVLVRLDADLVVPRKRTVTGTAITASLGATAGAGIAMAALVANVAIVAAVAVGGVVALGGMAAAAGVARSHRKLVQRVQLALEQVLDRLEHGDGGREAPLLDKLGALVKVIR